MVSVAPVVAALVPLLTFTCPACRHDDPPPSPPAVTSTPAASSTAAADAAAAGETVVGVDDDGKTFDVARGATIVFKLVAHGGTGFAWVPSPVDGASLAQQGERTTELSSDVPGAPRMDVYRFVGQAPGTTTIEMDLRRPWGDAPPVKTVRVTVNVR